MFLLKLSRVWTQNRHAQFNDPSRAATRVRYLYGIHNLCFCALHKIVRQVMGQLSNCKLKCSGFFSKQTWCEIIDGPNLTFTAFRSIEV